MNTILGIVIFFIVLFFYIHIYYHLKTSSDLEVFDLDNTLNPNFENICSLRQPVLFVNDFFSNINEFSQINLIKHYNQFDIKIRNSNSNFEYPNMELYKMVNLESGFKNVKSNKFIFSENNSSFINESGLFKIIRQNDEILRPPFICKSSYDLLIGSGNYTPIKYEVACKHYIIPVESDLEIKLIPPRYNTFLNLQKDYEYFQFISNENLWDNNFNKKIKSITFSIRLGQCLLIPPYWSYSLHFSTPNIVLSLSYYSLMNLVSISPDLIMFLFQQQNIKYKTACQIIKPTNNETPGNSNTSKKNIKDKTTK